MRSASESAGAEWPDLPLTHPDKLRTEIVMTELTGTERKCVRQCARHHALIDMPLSSGSAMLQLESLALSSASPKCARHWKCCAAGIA